MADGSKASVQKSVALFDIKTTIEEIKKCPCFLCRKVRESLEKPGGLLGAKELVMAAFGSIASTHKCIK